MQVGDLIKTIYSDRVAVVTEVNPLPTWNKCPFGVKFTMLDGKPISAFDDSIEGMQPSDKIRIVSTTTIQPVQFTRDHPDGWWRGGLWRETYA